MKIWKGSSTRRSRICLSLKQWSTALKIETGKTWTSKYRWFQHYLACRYSIKRLGKILDLYSRICKLSKDKIPPKSIWSRQIASWKNRRTHLQMIQSRKKEDLQLRRKKAINRVITSMEALSYPNKLKMSLSIKLRLFRVRPVFHALNRVIDSALLSSLRRIRLPILQL